MKINTHRPKTKRKKYTYRTFIKNDYTAILYNRIYAEFIIIFDQFKINVYF